MPFFQIALEATSADEYPTVEDTSAFLYDINLVYEVSRLATDPEHEGYKFSDASWSSENRPISDDQKLHLIKLRHESPLLLVAAITAAPAAVGALWGLLQIIDKIANWPLNRQILKLQRDKLIGDLRQLDKQTATEPVDIISHLSNDPDGSSMLNEIVERLAQNPIRITAFDIAFVKSLPQKRRENKRDPQDRKSVV